MLHCTELKTAPTAIARRPESRSRSSAWRPGRLPHSRLKPRSVTSGASGSIATTRPAALGAFKPGPVARGRDFPVLLPQHLAGEVGARAHRLELLPHHSVMDLGAVERLR